MKEALIPVAPTARAVRPEFAPGVRYNGSERRSANVRRRLSNRGSSKRVPNQGRTARTLNLVDGFVTIGKPSSLAAHREAARCVTTRCRSLASLRWPDSDQTAIASVSQRGRDWCSQLGVPTGCAPHNSAPRFEAGVRGPGIRENRGGGSMAKTAEWSAATSCDILERLWKRTDCGAWLRGR